MKTTGRVRVAMFLVVAVFLGIVALTDQVQAQQSNVIELTYGTPYPPDHMFSNTDKKFFAKIEKETNGRVKFKPYWGGMVLGGTGGAIDELEKCLVDIGFVSAGQAKTGFDIAKASFLFFAGANKDSGSKIWMELLKKFPDIEKEYRGLKVLSWMSGTEYQLITVKPAKTLAAMKGMRFKVVGDLVIVMKDLGIEGVTGPMPEAYMNMQKGIWDGVLAPHSQLKVMKFSDVAKYVTILDLYRVPAGSRAMCLPTWNKLPADIKEVFQRNIPWYGEQADKDCFDLDKGGMEFAQKDGVTFFSLPKEDMTKFKELMFKDAIKQAEKIDAKGLPGTKILQESQRLIKAYEK